MLAVVEKEPPYLVTVATIAPQAQALGEEECNNALSSYARCVKSGEWPCYTGKRVVEIDINQWVYRKAV